MHRAWRIIRVLLAVLSLIALLLLSGVFWLLWQSASVGVAYGAKRMASGVFVAGRQPESIASQELGAIPGFTYRIDEERKTVTGWVLGRHETTAVYREGLGVAIAYDGGVEALKRQARPELIPDLSHLAQEPWPVGDAPSGKPRPEDIDDAALAAAVDGMFAEAIFALKRGTRAVVVLYQGEVVAERYGEGFGPEQRFPAWSMTKSVTHALYGIASAQGKVDIMAPAPVPQWQGEGDPRSEITLDMLLRMSSGLAFNENDFIPPADLTTMLFLEPGAGLFAMGKPLGHPVDTVWAYKSGTTNILSWILRQAYGDEAYYALPYRELFGRIGMRSAMLEADATGTYVSSSFLYATARDFARFGLLYMRDGVWEGERILPEGWVEYARTATPTAPKENYGAHWWRPSLGERADAEARGTPLPSDTFHAAGYEGQYIAVIPSRHVVVVRLGLGRFSPSSFYREVWDVLKALPEI